MRLNLFPHAQGSPRYLPLLAGFGIYLLLIIWAAAIHHKSTRARYHEAAAERLHALAEVKKDEIVRWRQERLSDARFYSNNQTFVLLVRDFLDAQAPFERKAELHQWLQTTRESHGYNVMLFDAQGRRFYQSVPAPVATGSRCQQDITAVLASGQIRLGDIHFHATFDSTQEAVISLFIPLVDPTSDAPPFAVMVWEMKAADYLYPLLSRWPVETTSRETLLVRREGDAMLVLNPLLSQPDTALTLRIPLSLTGAPAVLALTGATEVPRGIDYLGNPVKAAIRAIPDSSWFLVLRIDLAEIEAPLAKANARSALALALLTVLVALALTLIWRHARVGFYRERLAASEALRDAQEHYRILFESSPDALFAIQLDSAEYPGGRVIEVNQRACLLLGRDREELLSRPPSSHQPPLSAPPPDHPKGAAWETNYLHRNGSLIAVEVTERTLQINNAPVLLRVVHNITERKKIRDRLRRLNRTLLVTNSINQKILRSADAPSLLRDACRVAVQEGGFLMAWVGILDPLTPDRLKLVASEGVPPGYLDYLRDSFSQPVPNPHKPSLQVLALGQPAICNNFDSVPAEESWSAPAAAAGCRALGVFPLYRARQLCGVIAFYSAESDVFQADEIHLLRDTSENLSFCLDHFDNESRRRAAESALAHSERRLRTLLENVPTIAIQGFDRNHRVIFWNEGSTRFYGYTSDEAMGRSGEELLVPLDQRDTFYQRAEVLFEHGETSPVGEITLRHKNGSAVVVYSAYVLQINAQGEKEIYCFDLDLTERNRAQNELQLLHAALQATPAAWVITDAEGIVEWVNPGFTTLTGYNFEEVVGHTPNILYSGQHKTEFYRTFWATIKAGKVWRGDVVNRRKDGTLYHENMVVAPVHDTTGRITNFVAIKQDITAHKKTEQQLHRAQRLEGIGMLAGGIAHDLNNVLAPILLSVELLKIRFPDQRTASSLDLIESSARRGANVVRQVLTFARGIDGERISLRPKDLLREITFIIEETFPRNIELARVVDSDLPDILGDPTQIHQVLLNLAVNARDAMPDGGKLTLSASLVQITETLSRVTGAITPGPYVRLSLTDTGHGILPELLDQIFEPFFTTKERGKGTGLGLSAVYGIVRSHGGFIDIKSTPGVGSDFEVHFPAQPRPATHLTPLPNQTYLNGSNRGILLCDDEDFILQVSSAVLEKNGFTPHPFASGAEALQYFAIHTDSIHLAILDVMMPGMTGDKIATALRLHRPDLPILFSTGMVGNEDLKKTLKQELKKPRTALLTKPYAEADLLAALAPLLADDNP